MELEFIKLSFIRITSQIRETWSTRTTNACTNIWVFITEPTWLIVWIRSFSEGRTSLDLTSATYPSYKTGGVFYTMKCLR